jgi:hypothetical protein
MHVSSFDEERLIAYSYHLDFPTMYKHMFTQRAKTLNPSSAKKVQ